ncbi:MAG: SulP family inorganic anion transporter [Candidatus Obscuribacterales bacterium]|nr:SulP family inorganic anion transporter [Candidatus Obscuribacterales bacterium]
MMFDLKRENLRQDFLASLVVFLVALPLCMGVAIASGMPPASGLLTGIVGGLVVGAVSGSPFQVSGPTVSLALIVWEIVHRFGVAALGVIVILSGLLQIAFGTLRWGRIFRALSPAVVQGMLSGIGLLILVSQFHVMLDDKPKGNGLENLLAIPQLLWKVITFDDGSHEIAALVGLLTISVILIWERLPVEKLRGAIPPTLLAVLTSTAVAVFMNLDINRVQLPENLFSALALPDFSLLGKEGWLLLQQALTVALVGSAETLLTANAIDRTLPAHKSNYDKELIAQGIGNTICGALSALPVAGVIVRSSVNVKAGARTKMSTVLHGVWLLLFTLVFPFVLRQIPSAALAALLVYTGYKLLDIRAAKRIAEIGKSELLIFAVTALAILVSDLFTGVVIGVTMSAIKLLYDFCKLDIHKTIADGKITLELVGAATFFSLPKLADALEALPTDTELHVDFSHVTYIDHASLDLLMKWEEQYKSQGGTLTIDWGVVQARFNSRPGKLVDEGVKVPAASAG